MKKFSISIIILIFLNIFAIPSMAGIDFFKLFKSNFNIYTNGQVFESSLPTLNYNGNVYVPLRRFSEALGFDIKVDNQSIFISNNFDDAIYENIENMVKIQKGKFQGSGIIIDNNRILTCDHVIDSNSTEDIKIFLNSNSQAIATLVYSYPTLDVAILNYDSNLKNTIRIGNSDNLKLGQHVIAIGSPNGWKNSVSEGIISAFRNLDSSPYLYIQYSSASSKGSSGGGLFTIDGELIGIIAKKSTSSENVNFAIPINEVIKTINKK